jgi:hypothetical protein
MGSDRPMEVSMKLQLISDACPEQYDAYYDGIKVGYFRVRSGNFTVEHPDVGGKMLFEAKIQGYGCFNDDERWGFMQKGLAAIERHLGIKA